MQVEYYFSDENLPTDKYLMNLLKKDKNGFGKCAVFVYWEDIAPFYIQFLRFDYVSNYHHFRCFWRNYKYFIELKNVKSKVYTSSVLSVIQTVEVWYAHEAYLIWQGIEMWMREVLDVILCLKITYEKIIL